MRHARGFMLWILASFLLVVLAACSSTTPPPKGTSSSSTASLDVVVKGLPAGVHGTVTVTGPGGYSKTLTATTTLKNLSLGTYKVAVASTSNGNTIVPTLYDGSASPSTLDVQKDASITVTYAAQPGSGRLWVPMSGGSIEAESLTAGNLAASGPAAPDATVSGSADGGESVAFDGAGNMWVADKNGYVYGYHAAQIGATNAMSPAVTINGTGIKAKYYGVAFDSAGDLWTASCASSSSLYMYTPSQLVSGGYLTPSVAITDDGSGNSVACPGGLAFDTSGDLWVANYKSNTVVEFSPSQLLATASPLPIVTLGASSGSINEPIGLAFDAKGNLWVGNAGGTVVRFDAGQLGTSASPTPAATISSSTAGTKFEGVAFDASGALWVATGGGKLERFTSPDGLTGSRTPSPDVTVSSIGSVDFPVPAFDPTPSSLPIRTP